MAEKRAGRTTMHTVAHLAGVSQTTVSLVLNNNAENIPEETRNRVWQAIKELGYRPSAAARRMRTHQSNFIGFITDQIATTPHAGKIVKGAQDVGWENGKTILLINTESNPEMEAAAIEVMLEQEVEGIIYASMFNHEVTLPETLKEVPTVLLDCFTEDHSFSAVIPDEIGGGYTATEALIKKGHRRIAFANHSFKTGGSVGRLIGYQRALSDYGIPYDESLVQYEVGEADGGYRISKQIFSRKERPSAIFCFNDRMAMGLYDGLRELNLSIPGDVAVMGFDNQELIAPNLHPALSTVELPHYEMGRQAVTYLLSQVGKPFVEIEPTEIVVPCPLVLRNSI